MAVTAAGRSLSGLSTGGTGSRETDGGDTPEFRAAVTDLRYAALQSCLNITVSLFKLQQRYVHTAPQFSSRGVASTGAASFSAATTFPFNKNNHAVEKSAAEAAGKG